MKKKKIFFFFKTGNSFDCESSKKESNKKLNEKNAGSNENVDKANSKKKIFFKKS
jgi:hypothetical protein